MKTLHRELLTRQLVSGLVLGLRSAHVDIGSVKLQKECEMVRFVIQLIVTLTFNRHQWLDSLKQFDAHDIPELSWARGHGVSYGDLQIICYSVR